MRRYEPTRTTEGGVRPGAGMTEKPDGSYCMYRNAEALANQSLTVMDLMDRVLEQMQEHRPAIPLTGEFIQLIQARVQLTWMCKSVIDGEHF